MPGILHFLQYEWHRFELERQEWEVEKAELAARIALLQGERKSHDNLKKDLVRRIKMLEYCLKMERAKYHKLKYGIDPPPIEDSNNPMEQQQQQERQQDEEAIIRKAIEEEDDEEEGVANSDNNSNSIAYGRELLRHYLQEIGYTDAVIDLRSSRVRSLLGIDGQRPNIIDDINCSSNNSNKQQSPSQVNNQSTNLASSPTPSSNIRKMNGPLLVQYKRRNPRGILETSRKTEENESAESVLATFKFLYDQEKSGKEANHLDDDDEEEVSEDVVDAADRAASTSTLGYSYSDKHYFERSCGETSQIAIRQKIDLLSDKNPSNVTDNSNSANNQKANDLKNPNDQNTNSMSWCPDPQKRGTLDIGELATLATLDTDSTVDDYRRKQWTAKYRLQSHFDCVRALKFVDHEPLLVTASEDETIKLWHLSRLSSNSGKSNKPNVPPSMNVMGTIEGTTLDLEPIHTYRGHTSAILCITVHKKNIYSGAQNGELFMWKIIDSSGTADQYDKFKKSLLACKFSGHNNAVWSLECAELTSSGPLLCSASADKTIRFWNLDGAQNDALKVIEVDSSPTHIASVPLNLIPDAGACIAIAFSNGNIKLYDIESCLKDTESNTQPLAVFETNIRVNCIVLHPTLPYLASADSNHDIKFWDLKTRKCISTMTAHLDEVTSLAIDPSGKYLLSGSHDCSVRLWLFEEKSCIQEITSHRKKYDEGIFAVAFHPKTPHFATAGADGLAKFFV